jgi:hypothetical protein
LDRRGVERAIEEAEVRQLHDSLSLPDLLKRHPGRRGSRTIREILDAGRIGTGITREELEERFRTLLTRSALPRPEHNVDLELDGIWVEADCVWRRERLIVELDGRAAHGTAAAFESDRARDRRLQVLGWRVVRVTWRQLHEDSDGIATDLRRLLRAQSSSALSSATTRRA